jgi:hypothetical protein
MAMVKVWNDNDYPHKERYKGDMVEIPAHGHVEMEWEEAIQFAGQFTPPIMRGDGTHDPRGFKKIRVERPKVMPFQEKHVNHANGAVLPSAAELAKAIAEFSHLRITDPDAEASAKTESDAEIAALRAELDELKSLIADNINRKPGRPRKEA